MDERHRQANLRAYLALDGTSLDWRSDLLRLLRSDAPIEPLVRARLATLIENQDGDGPSLRLHNVKGAVDRSKGYDARQQWMDIGRWITARRAEGQSADDALGEAESLFNSSAKKCEKALQYFRRADGWVAGALLTDEGAIIGRDELERLFHAMEVDPWVRSANKDLIEGLTLSQ